MSVPIVHIDYTEPDPSTYRGARVSMLHDGKLVELALDSGNPSHDYAAISKVAFVLGVATSNMGFVMCSSDVDNFVMDGGDLESWGK